MFLRAVQADQVHPLVACLQHTIRTNSQRTEDVPAKKCIPSFGTAEVHGSFFGGKLTLLPLFVIDDETSLGRLHSCEGRQQGKASETGGSSFCDICGGVRDSYL